MKKLNKRAISIASVTAILASIAAMPVSAENLNSYSVSYETLTAAITMDDGNSVPAGAIAVTMSIDGNSGFNSNTFALEVIEGYEVVTTSEGTPFVQKGSVLSDAMAVGAVNENKICVATASGTEINCDGDLFTVYLVSENASVQIDDLASIVPPEQPVSTASTWAIARTYVGDLNKDSLINATDAAEILGAISRNNGNPILYAFLERDVDENSGTQFKLLFPNAYSPRNANCIDDSTCADVLESTGVDTRVIDNADSQEILTYSATVGSGGEYEGMIGTAFLVTT